MPYKTMKNQNFKKSGKKVLVKKSEKMSLFMCFLAIISMPIDLKL